VDLTRKLIALAKEFVASNRVIPDRIISFFDPETRPIKKGKLSKTAEFGHKLRIDENEGGLVTGYELYNGNPTDDDLLVTGPSMNSSCGFRICNDSVLRAKRKIVFSSASTV
jgi:IS5 family transposase